MRDAPMEPLRAEFVSGMARSRNAACAATRDVPTVPKKEEFVKGMVRKCRRNTAATRDARTIPKREECVLGMARSRIATVAATRDAQTIPNREEFVGDMARGYPRNVVATNYTQQGGVCIAHGAKVKRCSHEGCVRYVVQGGVCATHGAKRYKKRCSHEGCANGAVQGGVCFRHCVKVKYCSHEGCTNKAVKGGDHSAKSLATAHREAERPPQPFEGSNATTVGAIARGGGEVVERNLQTHISHAICCQSPSLHPFDMATDDGCATFPTDDYGGNNDEHDCDDYDDAMGEWKRQNSLFQELTRASCHLRCHHHQFLLAPTRPVQVRNIWESQ
jgi:hypothetical protein